MNQQSATLRWRPWLTAARPLAHGMIALPLLWGQALALLLAQALHWQWLLLAIAFGALCQAYSLYLNDSADEPLDRRNDSYWLSGGSRVIPEGQLSGRQLYGAALALAVGLVLLSLLASVGGRPWMPPLTVAALALGWSYSLAPLQSSYRGYGELHQAVSCGVLLPVIGFYLQSGSFSFFPWLGVLPVTLIYFASNIVTALPDVPSDRQGGKRSYPVRHGAGRAHKHALLMLGVAYLLVLAVNTQLTGASWSGLLLVTPAFILLCCAARVSDNQQHPRSLQRYMTLTLGSQGWILLAWTILLFWQGAAAA